MRYPLYTPPKVPDRAPEMFALGAAIFLFLLIGWDLISLFSAGQLSAALRDASPLAAYPVGIPLMVFFFLRHRRRKAEWRKDRFHEGLRNG